MICIAFKFFSMDIQAYCNTRFMQLMQETEEQNKSCTDASQLLKISDNLNPNISCYLADTDIENYVLKLLGCNQILAILQ